MEPKCLLVTLAISSLTQDDSFKFKKVAPADFSTKVSGIDNNASVILLANVGSVIFYNN